MAEKPNVGIALTEHYSRIGVKNSLFIDHAQSILEEIIKYQFNNCDGIPINKIFETKDKNIINSLLCAGFIENKDGKVYVSQKYTF